MRINTKLRYGLRTIIEIANADELQGVLQKDIAVNQRISLKYLDPIIAALKVKGLIVNTKGKGSGYRLSRPKGEITMYDIYTAFESIELIECINNQEYCEFCEMCEARDLWADVKSEFSSILLNKTLEQIMKNREIKIEEKREYLLNKNQNLETV